MPNEITVTARVTVAVDDRREDRKRTALQLVREAVQPLVHPTSDGDPRFAIVTNYDLHAAADRWADDWIQFPRLLAEICATQDALDDSALCESMDLTENEVAELFDRAQAAWEAIKETTVPAPTGQQPGATDPQLAEIAQTYGVDGRRLERLVTWVTDAVDRMPTRGERNLMAGAISAAMSDYLRAGAA
jgi:hypothetical protein